MRCPASEGFRCLQLDGLGANGFILRLKGSPRNDIDPDAEQLLKVLEQASVINERGAFVEVHEQIEVAVLARLSPCDRSEHRDPASPADPGNAQDLRTPEAQFLQSQPAADHSSNYLFVRSGGSKVIRT
jgi:hypothetical protein